MKRTGLAIASFVFITGLALSSLAAREVVSGTGDKVDAMKGQLVLKTTAGPREFNIRTPEKLKHLQPGDRVSLTIQEDGTVVIDETPAKK